MEAQGLEPSTQLKATLIVLQADENSLSGAAPPFLSSPAPFFSLSFSLSLSAGGERGSQIKGITVSFCCCSHAELRLSVG